MSAARPFLLGGVAWTAREIQEEGGAVLRFANGREERSLAPAPPGWRRWRLPRLQDACLRAATTRYLDVEFPRAGSG